MKINEEYGHMNPKKQAGSALLRGRFSGTVLQYYLRFNNSNSNTCCNSISRGRERPCGCYISLGLMRTQLTCMSCFSYKPVYNLEKEEISCAFILESRLKHVLTCGLEHFPIFARIVWFCCRYFNTSMGQSRSHCIGFTIPQAVVLFPFVQVDFTQEMSNSSLSLESIKSIHL